MVEVSVVVESPLLFVKVFESALADAIMLEANSAFETAVVANAVARQAEQSIEQG